MYKYVYCITVLLCLYIGITAYSFMSQKTSGVFTAKDKHGTPVVIEWQKTSLVEPEFANAMKQVWPLTREAFIPVEMDFLRAYPQVVGTQDYYKPFEPLFQNGIKNVDWKKSEETMEALLKSHQIFDVSTLSPDIIARYAKEVYYFVTVKDQKTNVLCGYATFVVENNEVKRVMSIAVSKACRNRGLGKLLMSSIFKIKPDIERFFLSTRITNDTARYAYEAWGFTKDENPVVYHGLDPDHWMFFEYKVKQVDILQKTAEGFVKI